MRYQIVGRARARHDASDSELLLADRRVLGCMSVDQFVSARVLSLSLLGQVVRLSHPSVHLQVRARKTKRSRHHLPTPSDI